MTVPGNELGNDPDGNARTRLGEGPGRGSRTESGGGSRTEQAGGSRTRQAGAQRGESRTGRAAAQDRGPLRASAHGKRGALVLLCALGMLAAPGAGGAYAAPNPDQGKPDTRKLEAVRKKIERLHDRAESATEAYNGAQERTERQQKEIVRLARKIDSAQRRLDRMNRTAGAMARAQYRSGGMPQEAQVVLRKDPEAFLNDAMVVRKGQQAAKGFITTLTGTRNSLQRYAKDASGEYRKLEAERKRKAAAKKRIERDLRDAEKIESRLAASEKAELRRMEDEAAYQRQAKWLKSGVLKEIDGKATKAGKKAIAYATNQIGKDYEWGAEGPKTFDCSGLTLRAWQAAGHEIPRTSQEQWRQLKRVPLKKMRPGDLIIYKHDASHVGMYVGDGAMVNAPRTGRQIRIEGAGALPILGVVRPDA
ncbi:NlpC/P60 family protein [Streptomyces sp. ODS28]|uniref:NlpC/P60 family protein n=1 Tax=Streptomyces sp. ODS28 TaxID=3136688 RepID=UPI0031EB2317